MRSLILRTATRLLIVIGRPVATVRLPRWRCRPPVAEVRGRIALQDYGDRVAYRTAPHRTVKLRPLP